MAVPSPAAPPRAEADEPRPKLFDVEEYHRLLEVGFFTPDDRVELLDGVIYEMAPIGSPHAACVRRLNHLLSRAGLAAQVSPQSPVTLDRISEPEPDLALLVPRDDFYAERHPSPEEILLAVEVSDTSLRFDRGKKAPKFAATGIAELWIVDLTGERIIVHREPGDRGYGEVQTLGRGEELSPRAFPELRLRVDDVLG